MRKLFMDNWFIEEAVADMNDSPLKRGDAFYELLNAIVLWDEIRYPISDAVLWTRVPDEFKKAMKPIEVPDELLSTNIYMSNQTGETVYDDRWDVDWNDELVKGTTKIVAEKALKYVKLSHDNGCDYLPCTKRRLFLNRGIEGDEPIRAAIMSILDKNARDFYLKIFTDGELDNCKLEIPVLSRYILATLPKRLTPIEYALHMRYEGPVEKYRNYCAEMEEAYKEGYHDDYIKMRMEVAAMVDKVLSLDATNILTLSFNFTPVPWNLMPSVSLGVNIPNAKKESLLFLGKLSDFARKNPPIIF